MKRILLYFIILIAVLVLPTEGTDVADLQPVQTIAVYRDGNQWVIETDTEDVGRGNSVEKAFENLIQTAPAVIYLDTAQYLVVNEEAVIAELYPYLSDRVKICLSVGEPHMEDVSSFLSAHGDVPTVKQWKKGAKIPVLNCSDGRMSFR